jgi:hypothetical protein
MAPGSRRLAARSRHVVVCFALKLGMFLIIYGLQNRSGGPNLFFGVTILAPYYGHLLSDLQGTQRNSPASVPAREPWRSQVTVSGERNIDLSSQERILIRSMLWIACYRRAPYHLS